MKNLFSVLLVLFFIGAMLERADPVFGAAAKISDLEAATVGAADDVLAGVDVSDIPAGGGMAESGTTKKYPFSVLSTYFNSDLAVDDLITLSGRAKGSTTIADPNGDVTATTIDGAITELAAAVELNTAKETNTDDQTAAEVAATDEFDNSNSTTVQDVLDDLDAAMLVAADIDTWAEHPALTADNILMGSAENVPTVTTASSAFATLKQNASDSVTGVVELATDEETVTGTSDSVVVTPGNLTARLAAPGAIGGTTPATSIAADEMDLTATANPAWGFKDLNSGDTDKTIARLKANAGTTTAGSVDADFWIDVLQGGSWEEVLRFDESDDQWESTMVFDFAINDPNSDITATTIQAALAEFAAAIELNKALTPVTGDADDFAANFTGANLYGGTYVCNAEGDVDLPEPVAGMNFTVITMGDIEVDALPAAGDDLLLDGVQLDDNHDASNTGSAGDIAVFQYYDADGWLVTTNGWTEVAD
jgi:hypothetical protein